MLWLLIQVKMLWVIELLCQEWFRIVFVVLCVVYVWVNVATISFCCKPIIYFWFFISMENSKMGDKENVWKVVFFISDQTFTVLNSTSSKSHLTFDEKTSVNVRFGTTWFAGKIVASSATIKKTEQAILQMSAKNDEGKKIETRSFINCSDVLKCISHNFRLCSD